MVSRKQHVSENVLFLKILQIRYTGGRFSIAKQWKFMHFWENSQKRYTGGRFWASKSTLSGKWLFALAIQTCAQSFLKPCTEFSEACTEFSEKCSFDVGIHYVLENGAVAGTFLRFRALKTVEIHCFLSSPTWNLTAKSINPRNRKGFPKTVSCVISNFPICRKLEICWDSIPKIHT